MIHWSLQAWPADPAARARGEASLTRAERARLASLRVPKRQADWLAGRLTAKSVVAAALAEALSGDCPLRAIEIASGPTGAPYARVAPDAGPLARFAPGDRLPVHVSVSHAGAHALCAAAWHAPLDGAGPALGVDLEPVEPRSRELVATFFTEGERRFVRDAPLREADLRANLVWCAKEAVLKALGLGLTVDTRAVECRPDAGAAEPCRWRLAPSGGDWRPFLATCGASVVAGGETIRGLWRLFPGFVAALAARGAGPAAVPPRA